MSEFNAIAVLVQRWRNETHALEKGRLQEKIESLLQPDNARCVLGCLAPDLLTGPLALKALELWSEDEPAMAMNWLVENSHADPIQIERVVSGWLSEDPVGLSEFTAKLAAGEWKNDVLEAASRCALHDGHPENALSWWTELPPDRRSQDFIELIAVSWGSKDLGSATSWILGVEDPNLQDQLFAKMLGGYAQNNPVGAANFALNIFRSADSLNQALNQIVPVWSKVDARAAADWISTMPDSDTRQHGLDVLLPAWLANDEAAVSRWILSLPATAQRNESIHRIFDWAVQNNPETAAALLEHLPPDAVQATVQMGIVRQWARWDLPKASAWVMNLPSGPLKGQSITALNSAVNESAGTPF